MPIYTETFRNIGLSNNNFSNKNNYFESNEILSGYYFAFDASGGFAIEEGFDNIVVNPITRLVQIDTTNIIQIVMDYKYINSLLGFYYEYVDGSYNISSQNKHIDSSGILQIDISDNITINSTQFIQNININSVISVGNLSTLYIDYFNYIGNVFSNHDITQIYTASNINIIDTSFGKQEFINLIDNSMNSIDPNCNNILTGQVNISNIIQILNYSCKYNIFNNRPNNSYKISNGFQPKDLIYIQNGIKIKLETGLTNNTGSNIETIINQQYVNPITVAANDYESYTESIINNILSRTVQIPILIILEDLKPITKSYIINPFDLPK
jgi:hypothetical protein